MANMSWAELVKAKKTARSVAWMEGNYGVKIKYIPYDGGGAVAKDLAGQQIIASVNNPAEAKGFYESGDVVPLIAFSDERLAAYPDVRTVKELGKDFSYYNQRAVVGAPACQLRSSNLLSGSLQDNLRH